MSEKIKWHCSQEDCPFHPVAKEIEKQESIDRAKIEELKLRTKTNNNYQLTYKGKKIMMPGIATSNTMANNMFSVSPSLPFATKESIIKMDSPYVDHLIPIECTMCCHMEKMDMRELVIAGKAKEALRSE